MTIKWVIGRKQRQVGGIGGDVKEHWLWRSKTGKNRKKNTAQPQR